MVSDCPLRSPLCCTPLTRQAWLASDIEVSENIDAAAAAGAATTIAAPAADAQEIQSWGGYLLGVPGKFLGRAAPSAAVKAPAAAPAPVKELWLTPVVDPAAQVPDAVDSAEAERGKKQEREAEQKEAERELTETESKEACNIILGLMQSKGWMDWEGGMNSYNSGGRLGSYKTLLEEKRERPNPVNGLGGNLIKELQRRSTPWRDGGPPGYSSSKLQFLTPRHRVLQKQMGEHNLKGGGKVFWCKPGYQFGWSDSEDWISKLTLSGFDQLKEKSFSQEAKAKAEAKGKATGDPVEETGEEATPVFRMCTASEVQEVLNANGRLKPLYPEDNQWVACRSW